MILLNVQNNIHSLRILRGSLVTMKLTISGQSAMAGLYVGHGSLTLLL
jgi:hypothetical protein